MEIGDIESANGLLRVIGKGDKERRVPLPESMLAELRRLWLTHRPIAINDGCAPTGTARRPSARTLWRTFRPASAPLASHDPSAHTACATSTRLLESGVDTRVVQILLGHVNISTAVYPHLTEPTRTSLKATLDKLMTDL